MKWHWDFESSPISYRMTTPETEEVGWMISWSKCDILGYHWIKERKSPMGANTTLHRLFLRTPKSPLLVTTSHCAKFNPFSTGNQNSGCETGNTCISDCKPNICEISTVTPVFSGSSNTVGLVWILSDVGVSGKSKMAAINRKWICNHVYLSLYTW
jgi:hypothetical protein